MMLLKRGIVINALLILSAATTDANPNPKQRQMISFSALEQLISGGTPAPTVSPTVSLFPTKSPTKSPTRTPTISLEPSFAPTSYPSIKPSQIPTDLPSNSPSLSFAPTTFLFLRVVADDSAGDIIENYSLGQCRGDCDSDIDCAYGLVCFFRDADVTDVPGCDGDASLVGDGFDDFCIEPQEANELVILGDNGQPASNFPLPKCAGDCDLDADCATGLVCFFRDDVEEVPECVGQGQSGFDYCIPPQPIPPGSDDLIVVADDNVVPFSLQKCQGDCDTDGDCDYDLVCFQRDSGPAVPGCNGNADELGVGDEDYCVPPPTDNTLVIVGDDGDGWSTFPMLACMGDCDTDAECLGTLQCFQRLVSEPVPGCIGLGEATYDYCYDPANAP